jgi:hypothetical protein
MYTVERRAFLFIAIVIIYLTDFFNGLLWFTKAETSTTACNVYDTCFAPYGFSIEDFFNAWPR